MSGDVEALANELLRLLPISLSCDCETGHVGSCVWSRLRQEFNAIIAAHGQTVRAEALEEAAKEATRGPGWGPGLSHFEDRLRVHRWLGAKAAALRAQPCDDTIQTKE